MRCLVVFVDAMGPAQLSSLRRRLPWLAHAAALEGELGYSSGALATILTGAAPSAHGRMCLFSAHRAQGTSPLSPLRWMGLLPRFVHERGPVRRALARSFALYRGWTGYFALHRVPPEAFSWLDVPEREDLFTAASIGGELTFLERARRRGLRVFSARWQPGEDERWREVERALDRPEADLYFLYAPELDGALHAEGVEGPAARRALDRLAERVERARQRLLAEGPVVTLLVGDHGMAEVERVIDPQGALSSLKSRVFVDSTMLRFWGSDRELGQARAAAERWSGRWLDRRALGLLDCPVEGAPFGDAIFALDEGAIFAPSFVGGACRGMHGYIPGSASARAAVGSDRALPPLASLRDVAPLVLDALSP